VSGIAKIMTRRFQDVWKEQCAAAARIRDEHGVRSAFDYLVGEKLMTFADVAVTRPEFARELPRFVAEIRRRRRDSQPPGSY
jgi:phosphopantothenate synthetase